MTKKKIFFNGSIITMDEKHPIVEAVGIEGEKIIAVGKLEELKKFLGNNYDLIDLKKNTLLPGFIDCHLHPIQYLLHLLNPDLSNANSLKELQSIMEKAAEGKRIDELIIGFNFCEEIFDNPILPTRWDLDEACPNNPAFILRYDGHIGVANSKALELGGIFESKAIPEGGEIKKNEKGELTGVISEKALSLILSKITTPDQDTLTKAASKAFKIFARNGITSLHGIVYYGKKSEFGVFGSSEISILKSILEKILQNWYIMVNTEDPLKLIDLKVPPLDEGKLDGKFKVGSLKLFLDGSFGAKTACMFEPFTDAPEMCGFCVVDEDEIYKKMVLAHNNGFQIIIHAIGDKANRIAVNLYKRLLKEYPRENHRHRIEHASILTRDVIKDMKDNGIIASCQPPFINSEYNWLEKRIGKKRCKYTYPMKSIIDGGVVLASGSDCPVEDPNPILGLHALVNRNGFIPEECISMKKALKTYTINAAYAAFEENIKGSIEVGKLADFVILDKNPLEIPGDKIREIQVLETIIRGTSVYRQKTN
ncbi:MAG: amidohydrolase [Promethearchaeota archaeon]|nr:MAG: amidohydrolase [Candidatus Lokiarchaeota archaeon]